LRRASGWVVEGSDRLRDGAKVEIPDRAADAAPGEGKAPAKKKKKIKKKKREHKRRHKKEGA